ncbi:MAG TPA: hypothetical protein DCZ72_15605 [Armatimonadetes bacterium]|nr:hypothetical protein [Armatimonadota bacterium]
MTERIIKICIYTPDVTTAGPSRRESYTEAKRRQNRERHQAGPLPLAGCSCPSCHAAAEADRHATPEAVDDERFKIWVADQDHRADPPPINTVICPYSGAVMAWSATAGLDQV